MKRELEKAYQVGTVSVLFLHDLSFNCYLFDTFTAGSCFRYLRVVSVWNKKIGMKMLTPIFPLECYFFSTSSVFVIAFFTHYLLLT